jgi:alpha-L-arabinofuranosidase
MECYCHILYKLFKNVVWVYLYVLILTIMTGCGGGSSASGGNSVSSSEVSETQTNIIRNIIPGCVAYWSMDAGDIKDGVLTDKSNKSNNAVIHGATLTQGIIGDALYFDGIDDYISFNNINNDDISISLWFKRSSTDTENADTLFGAYNWSPDLSLREGFRLAFMPQKTNALIWEIVTSNAQGNKNDVIPYSSFPDQHLDQWYHVVVTYDSKSGEQLIYVNGEKKSYYVHPTGNTLVPVKILSEMTVGYSIVNNGYFNGSIDEVSVWNRALSKDEVLTLYGTKPQVKINYPDDVFYDQISVPLTVVSVNNSKIYYTTDTSIPTEKSNLYTGPIHITENTLLKARALDSASRWSETAERNFTKFGASTIKVDFTVFKKINELLFGTSILGSSANQTYTGLNNYGGGVWDPATQTTAQELVSLSKNISIPIFRFTQDAAWKETIGPVETRPNHKFGIDEFMKFISETGADVIYMLPYPMTDMNSAADLVEYLNQPNDGTNPHGGVDWASVRAANGHPEPYHVKYFELGNEVFNSSIFGYTPENVQKYIQDYTTYSAAMKEVDNTIKLGVPLYTEIDFPWDRDILDPVNGIGSIVDFVIIHVYNAYLINNDPDIDYYNMFRIAYGSESDTLHKFQRAIDYSGRKDLPIAITEFNGQFIQDIPYPFRYTLGNALNVAELLRTFMYADANIIMANYWQFSNSYFGMVYNDINTSVLSHYNKRPNYLVYELYRNHFGKFLTDVTVQTSTYDIISDYNVDEAHNIPFLSASASVDESNFYLMVINRNLYEDIKTTVTLNDTITYDSNVHIYTLTGPSIVSTNEFIDPPDNVRIEPSVVTMNGNVIEYTFPKHSITVFETKYSGTLPIPELM